MVALEGGSFLMGTDDPDGFPGDGEGPVREIELSAFAIEPVILGNGAVGDVLPGPRVRHASRMVQPREPAGPVATRRHDPTRRR